MSLLFLSILFGVSCISSSDDYKSFSSDKDIVKFWFDKSTNQTITGGRLEGVVNQQAQTITFNIFEDSQVESLIAEFELSESASVVVDGIVQKSGVTEIDFTDTKTYNVVAENGTTKSYKVTVNLIAPYSKECNLHYIEIDQFRFVPTSENIIYLRSAKDLSNVALNYSTSALATTIPDLSEPLNLTSGSSIKVVAEDGKTEKEYTIKVISEIEKLLGGDIQTLGWCAIPSDYTSVERFQQMKDAGFDVNLTQWYNSKADATYAIECAAEVGMKVILMCYDYYGDFENTISYFKDRPGFYGYYVSDEPGAARFEELGDQVRKIKAIDPNAMPYNNMFPNAASQEQLSGVGTNPPAITYEEYMTRFDSEIGCEVVSFDYYPLVFRNGVFVMQSTWFQNLEDIARLAESVDKPMWAFALSTPHWDFIDPTINNLRMQVFADLAYGAKCIQYFTYWTPVYDGSPFYTALINPDGSVSPIYYTVQQMNKELKAIAPLFANAKRVKTRHSGTSTPIGTTSLSEQDYPAELKSLNLYDRDALFAIMDDNGRRILIIQNTSPNDGMTFKIEFNNDVKRVMYDGYVYPLSGEKEVSLQSGDAAFYILN